ncbi:MAG: tetratricopeptide repeat protein [Lysobacter sp.]|nr:tetratricopeptide repeat protein [Lysobacter sp.]
MAIDDLLDEHEQGERVRTWLRENGAGLIGGVLLGLVVIGGWQWWQRQREQQRLHAGEQFQAVVDAVTAKQLKPAQQLAAKLPQGSYATLAALDLAKAQVDAGQRDAAIATLRAAQPKDPALAVVVSTRLAQLLVDAGKAHEALSLLPSGSADVAAQQVRGDALFALGQANEARAAYAQALAHADVGSPQRKLLELKLSQVGGAPAQPEAKS